MWTRTARRFSIASLLTIFLAAAQLLPAQETTPTPQTIEDALHQMSDLAAVIFLGQVIAVRHIPGAQGTSGLVEIDFHIDQAIRGCTPASTYTLREWAGLWESDDQRYQPGQNLLMMLHAPNAAGISSPVGGMNGAMPVRAGGPSSLVSSTASPMPLIVDLRWVGTRLLRTIPLASSPSLATGQTLSSSTPVLSTTTSDASISDTSVAAQQAPVSTVTGMLSSWQQAAQ